jgi:NB-ARC domain
MNFVGRQTELNEIEQLLGASRLVTITGVGGVGKTSVAARVAERLAGRFPDGVWLVRLSQLLDPALLPYAVARALGLQDQTTRPMTDVLADHLAHRRCLLVLDTCEHLVGSCSLLISALLGAAPGLYVIATTRQPLELATGATYRLEPMRVPDAVRLFAARARDASPGFEPTAANAPMIAELCRWLDGLPLALELAAALVRQMPLGDVAARLGDRLHLAAGEPAATTRCGPPGCSVPPSNCGSGPTARRSSVLRSSRRRARPASGRYGRPSATRRTRPRTRSAGRTARRTQVPGGGGAVELLVMTSTGSVTISVMSSSGALVASSSMARRPSSLSGMRTVVRAGTR